MHVEKETQSCVFVFSILDVLHFGSVSFMLLGIWAVQSCDLQKGLSLLPTPTHKTPHTILGILKYHSHIVVVNV